MQFNRLGLEVTTVANGREAYAAVQADDYDIIFMDCHMPVMDGFEATKYIREFEAPRVRRVPIVAMTADTQSDIKQSCTSAGMDDYVSKPTSIATLGAIVDRWLPSVPDGIDQDSRPLAASH